MTKQKEKLIEQIREFAGRFYKKHPDIIKQTNHYLDSADYDQLVLLMEKVDQDFKLSAGVLQFEVLGFAYELQGEHYATIDFHLTESSFEKAMGAYENGMHYATGSGEGWHFRKLYDTAEQRIKRLKQKIST